MVIRELISSLPVICTTSVRDVLLLIPRLLVLCLAVAPLALLLFIGPALLLTLAVDLGLFFYVIPGLLCQAASEMQTPCKRYCIGVLLLVLYPVVGLLACLLFSLSVMSYPLLGICLSNGLYDYLTRVVSSFTICYLRTVTCIIKCLMCTCP